MRPIPFRARIALLSAGISGAVLLGFGGASWYFLHRQRIETVDTEIRSLGSRHPGWLANRANFDRFNSALEFVFGDQHRGNVILLVKDAAGQTLYNSPNWPAALAPSTIDCTLSDDPTAPIDSAADEGSGPGRGFGPGRGGRGFGAARGGARPVVLNKKPRFFTVQTPESAWRLGVMGNEDLRLVVGLNYDSTKAQLDRMRNLFLSTVPLALALVGAGGWLVAGRALHPLRTIALTAQQVTARGLDQRVPLSDEDPEIKRLIEVLNHMMDRLEISFRQATRFSADASHELKTPLAIMQTELEHAIQSSMPGSPQQRRFVALLEQIQRLKRITSGLLLLSQADGGHLRLSLEEIPLSDDLSGIIEDAEALAVEAGLQFSTKIQPDLRVKGDHGLLRMAILNLLQNAVRYNQPGGFVGVTLVETNAEEVTLSVSNSGPGIPPVEQSKVFERFYRFSTPDIPATQGQGLGLSLAREIVHAHAGRLVLVESRPGHTCFAVTLKKATSTETIPQ